MKKVINGSATLLWLYGCLLVCLASYYIIRENAIFEVSNHSLPLTFLVRFGVLWFLSLMIAVTFYLAHINYHRLLLKGPEKVLARRIGYITFLLGLAGGIGMLLTALLFQDIVPYLQEEL